MGKSNWIKDWGAVVGLFITIIGTTSLLAFKIGVVNEKVNSMEKTLEDIPVMKTDITEMQVKLDVLWRIHLSKSTAFNPLTDEHLKALKTSGVDTFVNRHYQEILSRVKALKPDNTVQAQELLISVVNRYKKAGEHSVGLHRASLATGYDIDTLLLIAAVSMKQRMVSDLGLTD